MKAKSKVQDPILTQARKDQIAAFAENLSSDDLLFLLSICDFSKLSYSQVVKILSSLIADCDVSSMQRIKNAVNEVLDNRVVKASTRKLEPKFDVEIRKIRDLSYYYLRRTLPGLSKSADFKYVDKVAFTLGHLYFIPERNLRIRPVRHYAPVGKSWEDLIHDGVILLDVEMIKGDEVTLETLEYPTCLDTAFSGCSFILETDLNQEVTEFPLQHGQLPRCVANMNALRELSLHVPGQVWAVRNNKKQRIVTLSIQGLDAIKVDNNREVLCALTSLNNILKQIEYVCEGTASYPSVNHQRLSANFLSLINAPQVDENEKFLNIITS